jgi:hypothetical protein
MIGFFKHTRLAENIGQREMGVSVFRTALHQRLRRVISLLRFPSLNVVGDELGCRPDHIGIEN